MRREQPWKGRQGIRPATEQPTEIPRQAGAPSGANNMQWHGMAQPQAVPKPQRRLTAKQPLKRQAPNGNRKATLAHRIQILMAQRGIK